MSNYKLNKKEGKIQEMPGMDPAYMNTGSIPTELKYAMFDKEQEKYDQHLASLKSYDIEKDQWNEYPDGTEFQERELVFQTQWLSPGATEWIDCNESMHFYLTDDSKRIIARPKPSVKEKPDCSGHKKDLFGETDMKVVAEAIGDLHYETLSELLGHLGAKIFSDGLKDESEGRKWLGYELQKSGRSIGAAKFHLSKAWIISKPFMQSSK